MKAVRLLISFLCLCGIFISLYAIHVKRAKQQDVTYSALCDIDETFSCSSVLTSQFSDGLGVVTTVFGDQHPLNYSNASMGIVFYLFLLATLLSDSPKILLLACLASLCSCGLSVYLVYVLVMVLRKVCVVCYGTHAINLLLLILLTWRWRDATGAGAKSKRM